MRFKEALDKKLEGETIGVGVLEETASKDVPGTTELFTCETKGASV